MRQNCHGLKKKRNKKNASFGPVPLTINLNSEYLRMVEKIGAIVLIIYLPNYIVDKLTITRYLYNTHTYPSPQVLTEKQKSRVRNVRIGFNEMIAPIK